MSVTTTYYLKPVQALDLDGADMAADVIGLAGGGFAGIGDAGAGAAASFYDDVLAETGSPDVPGAEGRLAQLANGNVLLMTTAGAGAAAVIDYRLTDAAGVAQVRPDFSFAAPNLASADVAALADGGFVTVYAASDGSVDLVRHAQNGAFLGSGVVAAAGSTLPVVAGLADGGFAVAWFEAAGSGFDLMRAVYEADGAVRYAPEFVESTILADGLSITSQPTGGFAVAYSHQVAFGDPDVSLARFDPDGEARGVSRVQEATSTSTPTHPSVAAFSNGLLAVVFVSKDPDFGDTNVMARIVDPGTGLPSPDPIPLESDLSNPDHPVAAAFGHAGLAVGWRGAPTDGLLTELQRTALAEVGGSAIKGDDALDYFTGQTGADSLSGFGNDDALNGAGGADTLDGGAGEDTLGGGPGDDLLRPGAGDDRAFAGADVDTVDYSGGAAVHVSLALTGAQDTGASGMDELDSVENLIGTDGSDSLTGSAADNHLVGGGLADTLRGLDGADWLEGGASVDSLNGGLGDDVVSGGAGADTLIGGGGVDYLDYSAFSATTFVDLTVTDPQNTRSAGNDAIIGFENVITGDGDDRVIGAGSDNWVEANAGADTVKGRNGLDLLSGGDGNDKLTGGGDADTLYGAAGADFLRGGFGADRFVYFSADDAGPGARHADVIRDFSTAEGDRIDLSLTVGGTLTWIGDAQFSGSGPAELRVGANASGQLIQADFDGDGVSDFDIRVVNSGLTGGASDFVL